MRTRSIWYFNGALQILSGVGRLCSFWVVLNLSMSLWRVIQFFEVDHPTKPCDGVPNNSCSSNPEDALEGVESQRCLESRLWDRKMTCGSKYITVNKPEKRRKRLLFSALIA
ncbi:hypothetical protein BDN67DRAFT_494188 [Paxillus ammoniavirescens]|nr:hypothetical protein BDN67DRAFT_494188 [Paxillus ammoniavirescens]